MKPRTSCTSTACACARGCCRSASRSSGSRRAWRCCSPRRSRAQSLSSSVAQLSQGIVGNATLQIVARDGARLRRRHARRGRATSPGCAPRRRCWKLNANAIGPKGSESVELVGADASLSELGGALVRHTSSTPFAGLRRGRAALAARAHARRDEVRRGSHLPGRRARRAGGALRAAARQADRGADREPDRGRAALLRPGNGGSRAVASAASSSSPRPGREAAVRSASCSSPRGA